MDKKDLKVGYYYKSLGGEYYKYEVINEIPIFRISKTEYIRLDQFDDTLNSNYKSWSIIEELNKNVIGEDYISRFVSFSGNEIPFLVSEDTTGKAYMCYQGLKMFSFADGGCGDANILLNNWMFENEIQEDEYAEQYITINGKREHIDLWTNVVLVSQEEKILISKRDLQNRFSLILDTYGYYER